MRIPISEILSPDATDHGVDKKLVRDLTEADRNKTRSPTETRHSELRGGGENLEGRAMIFGHRKIAPVFRGGIRPPPPPSCKSGWYPPGGGRWGRRRRTIHRPSLPLAERSQDRLSRGIGLQDADYGLLSVPLGRAGSRLAHGWEGSRVESPRAPAPARRN